MTAFWVLMLARKDRNVYADLHKVRGLVPAAATPNVAPATPDVAAPDGVYYLTKEGADAALAALPAEESGWWHVVPMVGMLEADAPTSPPPLRPFMTREGREEPIDEDMAEDSCALIVFARTTLEAASMCMGFNEETDDPEEWARPLTARDVEQVHDWLMHYVSRLETMQRERDAARKALAAAGLPVEGVAEELPQVATLGRRLCPGCGRVWRPRAGACKACRYECQTPPPSVRACLAGKAPPEWADFAGVVRGVAKALGTVAPGRVQ